MLDWDFDRINIFACKLSLVAGLKQRLFLDIFNQQIRVNKT